MPDIKVYTDGACSGNPGPGGWGVVIEHANNEHRELCGGVMDTTNNRMELLAAITALRELSDVKGVIHLYTDSTYVKDGITKWVQNWLKNGWRTASNKDVKNKDLWQDLYQEIQYKSVEWHWVKGHAGHPQNERADMLARNGIMQAMMKHAVNSKHQA